MKCAPETLGVTPKTFNLLQQLLSLDERHSLKKADADATLAAATTESVTLGQQLVENLKANPQDVRALSAESDGGTHLHSFSTSSRLALEGLQGETRVFRSSAGERTAMAAALSGIGLGTLDAAMYVVSRQTPAYLGSPWTPDIAGTKIPDRLINGTVAEAFDTTSDVGKNVGFIKDRLSHDDGRAWYGAKNLQDNLRREAEFGYLVGFGKLREAHPEAFAPTLVT